jgi:hypothetical protein
MRPRSISVDVETVPAEFLVEVIEVYSVTWTWEIHIDMLDSCTFTNSVYVLISLRCLVCIHGELKALRSTYVCEKFFSEMKVVKSKSRNLFGDGRLENYVRVATSHMPTSIYCYRDGKKRVLSFSLTFCHRHSKTAGPSKIILFIALILIIVSWKLSEILLKNMTSVISIKIRPAQSCWGFYGVPPAYCCRSVIARNLYNLYSSSNRNKCKYV